MHRYIPSFLSVARLVLLPVAVFELVNYRIWGGTVTIAVMLLTDLLDGNLARRWNSTSTIGALLDHGADKIIAVTLAWVAYRYYELPLWVFYFVFVREILIVIGGIYLWKVRGRIPGSNLCGKVAGTFLLAAIYGYIINIPYKETFLAIALAGTIIAAFNYLFMAIRYVETTNQEIT